jgi:hypothetical protein
LRRCRGGQRAIEPLRDCGPAGTVVAVRLWLAAGSGDEVAAGLSALGGSGRRDEPVAEVELLRSSDVAAVEGFDTPGGVTDDAFEAARLVVPVVAGGPAVAPVVVVVAPGTAVVDVPVSRRSHAVAVSATMAISAAVRTPREQRAGARGGRYSAGMRSLAVAFGRVGQP